MDTVKNEQLIISVSPHLKSGESTERIMWTVNLSLLPALLMGFYYFGPAAMWVTLVSILSAIASEWGILKIMDRPTTPIRDGSAFLTGLLIAMNMPATVPFYIPVTASFIAIVITKQLFGGLGFNVFNPALVGRAFVLISWPRAMTTWMKPDAHFTSLDAATTATPLGILKEEGMGKLIEVFGSTSNLYSELLFGHRAGSLGEVSIIAILIGAAILFYKGYISWHTPISFLATVALVAWIFGKDASGHIAWFAGDPIMHLLQGGLMLGAFYMATDYVTSPNVKSGQIVFGIGCGLITMLIRLKGGFPEGVMFAILIMNCFAPLIDRSFKTRTFGLRVTK